MRILLALAAICVSTYGYGNRIIGGEDANIEDIPYQVAVLNNGNQVCGGSIIAANWVLTAAHCTAANSIYYNYTVRVGSSISNAGGFIHQVKRTIIHPKRAQILIQYDYDYALLELATPVPLGQPGVAAIEIAEDTPEHGDTARVSGWGLTSRILQLKTVNLPIVSREECRRSYGCEAISERMICAGWRQGGNNTCNGDSGGPLVVDGRQVGIVSWAMGCAQPEFPTVFADVVNQRRWILKTIGQL